MSLLACLTGAYSSSPTRAMSLSRCVSTQKSCRRIMQHMFHMMRWAFVRL